jgi:hypothetical protein
MLQELRVKKKETHNTVEVSGVLVGFASLNLHPMAHLLISIGCCQESSK